jgi:hypothetical protein
MKDRKMRKFMNVSNILCLAFLVMAFTSCKKEVVNQESGSLVTRITFARPGVTRAASTAIPETSWDNIKQVQMFLYDVNTNVIKFSSVIKPPASGVFKHTWTSIPAGTYRLALVANTNSNSDPIETSIALSGAPAQWNDMSVRNLNIEHLGVHHKPGAFPQNIANNLTSASHLKAFNVPSEIFTGYHEDDVTIASGVTSDLSSKPVILTREVALMRVRVRTNDKSKHFDNTTVDFTHADASILIYTLPDKITVHRENGDVSTTSDDNNILVASAGATTFFNENPKPNTGYGASPGTIIDQNFELWRDVIVFPNNGGKKVPADNLAPVAQRYYVVITGHAPQGYKMHDQSLVNDPNGMLVHWDGLVQAGFERNIIRELNLTLASGGKPGIPTQPAKEGSLIIEISAPTPWSSNIKATDIEL